MKTTIIVGLLLLVAGAFASCVELSADSTAISVPQYEMRTVDVSVKQLCMGKIALSVEGDVPASFGKTSLEIPQGNTVKVQLILSPGPMDAGIYGLKLKASDGTLGIAVTVTESAADPLMLVFPVVMGVPANEEPVDFDVSVRNDGLRQMNNVLVFMEEDGVRTYNKELLSVSPGETEKVNFSLGARKKGLYKIEVTAVSGDFIKKRLLNLEVGTGSASTIIRVDAHGDNGYLVKYMVQNNGATSLNNLFVGIDDAPIGWEISSPASFDLMPGESREVQVVVTPKGGTDSNVTVSLLKGQELVREDKIELSRAALHGTGLITLGDSLALGIALLLAFGAAYFVYTKRGEIEAGKFAPWEKLRSLLP